MSLGGYKFAGRYCQKGSLTDAQWALLMHKTKVAAFMAANALANAGWDYDMTGSPDGNYHCLDSVGNNYVTCFKRTNGVDDYTLSNAGWDYDMAGSPDGNYHCLDTVGNNYVTVFKRTNGEDDYTWFALE